MTVFKIRNLGLKNALIVSLLIIVIVVLIVDAVSVRTNDLITTITEESALNANRALVNAMQANRDEAYARAMKIAGSPYVKDAILSQNENALRIAINTYSDGLDAVTITDAGGYVLLRTHNDGKGDNILNEKALSAAISTGKGVSTIEKGPLYGLSTRGSAVIKDDVGNIIGAVTCGHDLSLPKYVDSIKEMSNCEVTVFDGDTRINTTITDEKGARVIGTKVSDAIGDLILRQRKTYNSQITLFGSEYAVCYSPLIVDNEVLGILFAGVHIDNILVKQQNMLSFVITLAAVTGIISALLVFFYSMFSISRPLKKIGKFADKIRVGNLGISSASQSTIGVRSSDEVGVLARTLEEAYSQLKGYIDEIQERMHELANGDLTSECTYDFNGDFVLIKDSINVIVNNLNNTMSEINRASLQVASNSSQISDGAQLLAQGSTEQAATVQQLSVSISDIAEKTRENSSLAGQAANLAQTIQQNAEKGSRQMDAMMGAVNEINQASQSISKVIKVIDDIAFQTNILALNAAVEAARAGQHGKGFAVVAEEVRNLAAKSAEAAKDTDTLIANSMQKAELGAKIAKETAASLVDIVSGIYESNKLTEEIAKSSENQSFDIRHVNDGIEQVAQVVQQNSATAEESAAASELLNGQASTMEKLIAQFKLKDSGAPRISLPHAAKAGLQHTASK